MRSGDDAVIPDRAAGCAQATAHPSYLRRRVEANTNGEEVDVKPHDGHDHFLVALKRNEGSCRANIAHSRGSIRLEASDAIRRCAGGRVVVHSI